MNFRIRKGTHVSHFHRKCPRWPLEDFYEQDKPLWWGNLCEDCSKLADIDAARPTEIEPRRGRSTRGST